VIINGALEDEAITQVVNRTSEFITRNGGEIGKADHWGRRRLAYPINKKNNGYYIQYNIDGPAALVQQMERFFMLEEHVIRHLTLQLDDNDLKGRDEVRSRLAAELEAQEQERRASEEGGSGENNG
jgi:small subunit ribosomal protein S6